MSNAQTMQTALDANITVLEKRGMSKEFIAELRELINYVMTLNSDQERMKGQLKATTVEFESTKAQLQKKMSEAAKVVKLEIPQERWIEFGISGKR
jgi:hypothetical protein